MSAIRSKSSNHKYYHAIYIIINDINNLITRYKGDILLNHINHGKTLR